MSEQARPGNTARAEWGAHWPIPVVSLVALIVAFAHVYTIGVFLSPIQRQFHWSRAGISAGLTIVSVISVVCAPFTGMLIDRFGPRRIALPGLVLYCGFYAALSLTGTSIWNWWLIWLLVGVGSVCTKPTVWAAAISARFDKARGAAMSVALCGSGVGGMFLPILATLLIGAYGWRTALIAIGLGGGLLSLPFVYLFFHDARDPARTSSGSPTAATAQLTGVPLREGLRSGRFLRLAAATLLITVALLSLTVAFVPILVERGLTARTAAATAGLVGVSTIVGRIVTGLLLDRFRGPPIGAVAFGLPIVACLLLLQHGGAHAALTALLLGLSVGSEVDVVMYMASRYFGMRHFGVLYGTLNGLTSLGTGLGPLLSGYVYDRFASYDPLFILLIPVFGVAMLLVGTLGAYPEPSFGAAPAELPAEESAA